jgi:hypothetical protein
MDEAKENVSSPKGTTAEAGSNAGHGTPKPNLFALTISADTGEIVKVEKVEGVGTRRDLRDDERVNLSAKAAPTLDALIERAFEAGIACVLGVQARHAEIEETDEEADLRRALLMPLMENTWAQDSLKRELLGKAILASAIAQVAAAQAATLEKGGTQQKTEGATRRAH